LPHSSTRKRAGAQGSRSLIISADGMGGIKQYSEARIQNVELRAGLNSLL
jgi:hypothetical protein